MTPIYPLRLRPASATLSDACRWMSVPLLLIAPMIAQASNDSPEATLGGRLFADTRFSQYFFSHYKGDVNAPLEEGDPVMETSETAGASRPGPFKGESMNCRACHMVDEFRANGMRTYADFARRSPIPDRDDGLTRTVRNSQALVSAARPGNHGILLHNDGQFATMPELVASTFTGRNLGWLPGERAAAIRHFAKVIRGDDGKSALAKDKTFGISYRDWLAQGPKLGGKRVMMNSVFKLDVATASDEEVFDKACALVGEYVASLKFVTDEEGLFYGSPYDRFLKKNDLPRQPGPVRPGVIEKETDLAYARRLRAAIEALGSPQWIGQKEGRFLNHGQEFQFGPLELEGLKIFLAETENGRTTSKSGVHAGSCITCHAPPSFTDFSFHNTGATQEEYDSIHGRGAFTRLKIPGLRERAGKPDAYLPVSESHPKAAAPFESIPDLAHPGHTDLGIWNVLFNPDIPHPQERLMRLFSDSGVSGSSAAMLDASIARFKTPSLRDLGDSAPYLHNGSKDTVEDVLRFYTDSVDLALDGRLRNGDPAISKIHLEAGDIEPLSAFLKSLDEDYDN